MKIKTLRFGEIEFDNSKVIVFKDGLPGLNNLNEFIIFEQPGSNGLFYWLQAVKDEEIALLLTKPSLITQYSIDRELVKNKFNLEQTEVFTTVNLPEDFTQATTNLRAPILIDLKSKKGKQLILTDENLSMKYSLYNPEIKREE